jgi:hypothetical protein
MNKQTHIVIAYDHATKSFYFDDDGTREWITKLFTPETNTWSDDDEDWVGDDDELLQLTIAEFQKLIGKK